MTNLENSLIDKLKELNFDFVVHYSHKTKLISYLILELDEDTELCIYISDYETGELYSDFDIELGSDYSFNKVQEIIQIIKDTIYNSRY